ncbi:uncharacterized protein LOC122904892 [Neovison vison]|uniref:uncharacterized protein LOC122904892 n=1 Tax=Neovison vison TaxID=452646 RepID=UPI001CEFC8BF|nr:uncharacterized protein LOC122904892 [Neogale vison]
MTEPPRCPRSRRGLLSEPPSKRRETAVTLLTVFEPLLESDSQPCLHGASSYPVGVVILHWCPGDLCLGAASLDAQKIVSEELAPVPVGGEVTREGVCVQGLQLLALQHRVRITCSLFTSVMVPLLPSPFSTVALLICSSRRFICYCSCSIWGFLCVPADFHSVMRLWEILPPSESQSYERHVLREGGFPLGLLPHSRSPIPSGPSPPLLSGNLQS